MKPMCGNLSRILVGNPLGGSYADGAYTGMWEQGDINIDTGEETSSGTGVRSVYLDARENAYYTQRTIGWGTFDKISWYFYTSEKEFLGVKTDTTWTALELAPVNCAYIRLVVSNDATPISPVDVPDIILEDRSIWGWKDPNKFGAIVSTKLVVLLQDHYYYQENTAKAILRFDSPRFILNPKVLQKLTMVAGEESYMYLMTSEGATPTNIGDLVFEDRDVWGWNYWHGVRKLIVSEYFSITKPLLSASYAGDLNNPMLAIYLSNEIYIREYNIPVNNVKVDGALIRLFIKNEENPNVTPADMVNHGTWTVTFSDPVSEVWKDDGTDLWRSVSPIEQGKSLTITAPSELSGCYIVYQASDGRHSEALPYTIADTTGVEWIQEKIPKANNPAVDLTNVDDYNTLWKWTYKDIPAPAEPHWEGENFVFSVSDIQVGKAWQKSGNDIVLVDDASSIALPIIPNVSASWAILIDNSSDNPLVGVEIRKTSSGVTVGDGTINANAGRSIILQDATGQVAFHFTKGSLTADTLYSAIKIHGR